MIIGLLSMLLAGQQVAGTDMLLQCDLRSIDPKSMTAVAGDARTFAILLPNAVPGEAIVGARVYDPTAMLKGSALSTALLTQDGGMFFAQTDANRPQHYRIAMMLSKKTGGWNGSIGLNGAGSPEQHLAGSFLGPCSVTREAGVREKFEALGR